MYYVDINSSEAEEGRSEGANSIFRSAAFGFPLLHVALLLAK